MAVSSVTYNKPVLPRTTDGSDLGSNRASIYSGKGLSFDGVNDYVTGTNIPVQSMNVGWTISMYVNPGTYSVPAYLFDFREGSFDGYSVYMTGSSGGKIDLNFYDNNQTHTTGAFLPENEWSLLTFNKFDPDYISVYLNGEYITAIYSNATYNVSGNWYIGTRFTLANYYSGDMADFRVYTESLSVEQIRELYNNPEQSVPTGVDATSLVLHLPMTEGSGYVLYNANANAIGTELISNAGFDETCQKWGTTDSNTVEIAGGKAIWTNAPLSGSFVEQPLDLEVGKFYRVKFDYTSTAFNIFVNLGDTQQAVPLGNGTYVYDMYYGSGSSSLKFQHGWTTNSSATVDNVSVKEVVPNYYNGTINGASWVQGLPEPLPQTALMDWNKGSNEFEQTDFGDSYWTKNGVTVDVYYDDKSFEGQVYKVTNIIGGAYHNLYHPVINKTDYYYSVYAKAGSVDTLAFIEVATSPFPTVQFNLSTGTITETINSVWEDYSMTDVGNGWYHLTARYPASSSKVHYNLIPSGGDADGSYTGSTDQYIYLASPSFSQYEYGYVPTFGTAQTSPLLIQEGSTAGKDVFGNTISKPRASGAYNFDGDSYAKIENNSTLYSSNNFTLEAWVYSGSNQTGTNRIINKWDTGYPERTYQLSRTAKALYLYISNGSNSQNAFAANAIDYDTWNHVVGVYDSDRIRIYVNGVEIASNGTGAYTLKNSTEPVLIGAYSTLEGSHDSIANPRIYNYALTAEQVADNFNEKASTFGGTKVASELDAYIERTASDGATVEAHSCLVNYLTELDKK